MDEVKGITYLDKLRLRGIEVERTIRHLEKSGTKSKKTPSGSTEPHMKAGLASSTA